MDPAALAVMAVMSLVTPLLAAAVVVARADRHPLLAQREHFAMAVLAGQGGLQALGALELQ